MHMLNLGITQQVGDDRHSLIIFCCGVYCALAIIPPGLFPAGSAAPAEPSTTGSTRRRENKSSLRLALFHEGWVRRDKKPAGLISLPKSQTRTAGCRAHSYPAQAIYIGTRNQFRCRGRANLSNVR